MLPMQYPMYSNTPAASSVTLTSPNNPLLEDGGQIENGGVIQAQVHAGMQDAGTSVFDNGEELEDDANLADPDQIDHEALTGQERATAQSPGHIY